MRITAHTPGPWSYNRDEGGMHGHVISTGEYIICDLPDAGAGAAPHTEANARLIAAAPELLEALEHARMVAAQHLPQDIPGAQSALDMYDRAIAKAKGGRK